MPAPVGAVTVIVPVPTEHVGCSVALAVGAAGAVGAALMVTLVAAGELQVPLDTVKLYVPAAKPEIVVVVVVPVIVPGIIVQLPVGNPLNITLPVASAHVG